MLLTVIVILLILALLGVIPGVTRYGPVGASPLVVIILILVILWLLGALS